MSQFWDKFKTLFNKAKSTFSGGEWVTIAVILAGLAVLTGYNISHKNNKDGTNPEVAQVYEPSIGEPLPPDNPGEKAVEEKTEEGEIAGSSTSVTAIVREPNSVTNFKETKVAPKTGIDLQTSVSYRNDNLKFSATLPAGSQVNESSSSVKFTDGTGKLQYLVSVSPTTDNLSNIVAQLKLSPTASNISITKFLGQEAASFNAQGYGNGIVFLKNGKSYYLLGNAQYFNSFTNI